MEPDHKLSTPCDRPCYNWKLVFHKFSCIPTGKIKVILGSYPENSWNYLKELYESAISNFFGNAGNIFILVIIFIFRNLMRKPWIQALNTSATPKDFARALTVLQCCIKPCLMVNVWYESLGHTMLKKISQAMKDDKKKSEKRERYVYF